MADSAYYGEDGMPLTALEDDCKLLGSLLDNALITEVGEDMFRKIERVRTLAQCAGALAAKGEMEASAALSTRMQDDLFKLPIDEAIALTRACGQYLSLTAVAELHHRVRESRHHVKSASSCDEVFSKLRASGMSSEDLHQAVSDQCVEIVLTAHPTQVLRRTLQYKYNRIAALLQHNDRSDLTEEERALTIQDMVREVAALWQTDELRREQPSPLDEARGGLHTVEQSLWSAVPNYIRRMSSALKAHTGKDLPLNATPFKFGSWMGGDRDGNPNVTSKITRHVVYLAKWMAADLYLREMEALRFELSMGSCSRGVWAMARKIMAEHARKYATAPDGVPMTQFSSGGAPPAPSAPAQAAGHVPHTPVMPVTRPARDSIQQHDFPAGMRPGLVHRDVLQLMPETPHVLPDISNGGHEGLDGASDDEELESMRMMSRARYARGSSGGLSAKAHMSAFSSMTNIAGDVHGLDLQQASLDPSSVRKTLMSAKSTANPAVFRISHEHSGFHPYRIILGDLRNKLMATRKRMEDLMANLDPSGEEPWLEDEEELVEPLLACYWSLWECGGGVVADGRLLDLIRRIYAFGMCLLKLDVRQESTRHAEVLDAATTFLGFGSYMEWDEDKKLEFLTRELGGRRPLIPADMPMSDEVKEVMETFHVVAKLGSRSLGAYVISMTRSASDVLAVELLQREAYFQINAKQRPGVKRPYQPLRVVPLFETLDDLDASRVVMEKLFTNPWYRGHVETTHSDHQEVMLGYSDSGKDAGRLAANWALYRCQEQLVELCSTHSIHLTLFHGRGGSVGRGGGPTHLAIQSQAPGSVTGSFRITEQGEMVMAKFGNTPVAMYQLEIYETAVLLATVRPPKPPRCAAWRDVMDTLSRVSCKSYRGVVFEHPHFLEYFKHATPEAELGNLNIGSRPARRRKETTISTLRAIPWIFAWTQTRLVLPSWLGVGSALKAVIENGQLSDLRAMYLEWPFFQATVDLIEMILSKSDMRIAALYDEVLVTAPEEKALGEELRSKFHSVVQYVLEVTRSSQLLERNPTLRRLLMMRNPYIDPVNILQTEILRRLRQDPESQKLRDALLISINGIAAGMRNTG